MMPKHTDPTRLALLLQRTVDKIVGYPYIYSIITLLSP